jgi:hypothetical protein
MNHAILGHPRQDTNEDGRLPVAGHAAPRVSSEHLQDVVLYGGQGNFADGTKRSQPNFGTH